MATTSWLPVAPDSPYSLANLPIGIVSSGSDNINSARHPAILVGTHVLLLDEFSRGQGFRGCPELSSNLHVFQLTTLNEFAALGRRVHSAFRTHLQSILRIDTPYPDILKDNADLRAKCLLRDEDVTNHLPLHIPSFTDFYGGMNHAINAGSLVRSRETAVNPNYHHLPEAYHSRASSVVVSGTSIHRPSGQINRSKPGEAPAPVYAPSAKLDFELELGAIVCQSNTMGHPIPIAKAEDAIFGFVLLNDWSARDIQQWEYVPLGPFNGKNFATSISGWVVMADALEPFRCPGLARKHELPLLPYLQGREDFTYDLTLKVDVTTSKGESANICTVNASRGLVYSFEQMLAHHTSTGCPMQVGDLLGSGTVSGEERGTWGCLLEITQSGRHSLTLGKNGAERTWLQDGDTVTFTAQAGAGSIGFGPCSGILLPALVFEGGVIDQA